jgi:hypothetical protein
MATKAVAIAGLVTVGVGTANSVLKEQKPPSTRFLIGCGVAFFAISAIGEAEPEVANALAFAVMVTVLLSDQSSGVLEYFNNGEMDTAPRRNPPKTPDTDSREVTIIRKHSAGAGDYRDDSTPPFPGLGGRGGTYAEPFADSDEALEAIRNGRPRRTIQRPPVIIRPT